LSGQFCECSFDWELFGVLDDSNHFVAGVTWIPRSRKMPTSTPVAFNQVYEVAPGIKTMPNIGSVSPADLSSTNCLLENES
jgi:hypothetical protein